jgi:outer membrane protein assembly factor BamB
VWQKSVGSGFASVAIAGTDAIVFHRRGKQLLVDCLDAATGQQRWQATLATKYSSTISTDDGPRCTPIIHEAAVFVLGPGGELAALERGTGKVIWSRDLAAEFRAPEGYFGFGSSPLVEGDKLLINVGGVRGAGIVAFSLADGKVIWKATDEGASYSSPVAATVGGIRHAIFVTRLNVVSVDPLNGKERFRFPFGARGPTVNAASPLVLDGHLFVSASYGVGAQWSKIEAASATKIWANDDVVSSQYTTCVEHEGVLYGIDGRQDVGRARLRAFDPQTGSIHWTQDGFGTGGLILVGDKLVVMCTDGRLVVAAATPKKFEPLAEAQLFEGTAQALPALAGGLLFVRDTDTLKCVRVGGQSAAPAR